MRCGRSLDLRAPQAGLWAGLWGGVAAIALSACAGGPPEPGTASGPPPAAVIPESGPEIGPESGGTPIVTADGRFDSGLAAALLAEAQAAEAAGRTEEALDLYRRAGLAWPDMLAAWQGLADLVDRADRPEETRAARFMAERVQLYPSGALFVQRDVARALRRYVAAQEAAPGGDAQQLAYAAHLADFYEARYAERGVHQPLDPFFNLETDEIPTALLTGVGGAAYFGALVSGD